MQLKAKIRVLSWVAALLGMSILAVVCVTQRRVLARLEAERRAQAEDMRELDRLRAENKLLRPLQNQAEEVERLRENTEELLRLRNEVTQLRTQVREMETLRTANAQLLQALTASGQLSAGQQALVNSARKRGAILGVMIRPPTEAPPQADAVTRSGVEVLNLDTNSPVATSGMQPGDWIVAIDGRAIRGPGELQAEMLTRTPGETVTLDVVRTNTVLRFRVQTRDWPEGKP